MSVFSFLAAQRWLPTAPNLLSELGLAGKVFAGTLLTLGIFAATLGIFRAREIAQKKLQLAQEKWVNPLQPSLDDLSERQRAKEQLSLQMKAKRCINEIKQEVERSDPEYAFYEEHCRLAEILFQEIGLTEDLESPPQNAGWAGSFEEKVQSFESFFRFFADVSDRPICVYLIGQFRAEDRLVIEEALEFIKVFHCKEIVLMPDALQMQDLKTQYLEDQGRDGDLAPLPPDVFPRPAGGRYSKEQYRTLEVIRVLSHYHRKGHLANAFCMALTSEHLYSTTCSEYVFGSAHRHVGGVFSNYLFGDPTKDEATFYRVLEYLMKIIGHEFGHILGLEHCPSWACNIGGYISLPELAMSPYTYCARDTAKLCLNSHLTLKEYYTRLRAFCIEFDKAHSYKLFEDTIAYLDRKIVRLESHPELYSELS